MKYRVIISSEALQRAERFLDYIEFECHAPLNAKRWWEKALAAIESLATFPQRCPFAPENDMRDYEIRMLIVDRCLFLFNINDADQMVRVISFRHGAQLPGLVIFPRKSKLAGSRSSRCPSTHQAHPILKSNLQHKAAHHTAICRAWA